MRPSRSLTRTPSSFAPFSGTLRPPPSFLLSLTTAPQNDLHWSARSCTTSQFSQLTPRAGQYEDVKGINDALLKHNEKHDLDVHIHVDAASGGFVAPFVNPDLVRWLGRIQWKAKLTTVLTRRFGTSASLSSVSWRAFVVVAKIAELVSQAPSMPRVTSTGSPVRSLVSPISRPPSSRLTADAGVGWAVWRHKAFLPDEILFTVNCASTLLPRGIPADPW